jgi:hypothetical protein
MVTGRKGGQSRRRSTEQQSASASGAGGRLPVVSAQASHAFFKRLRIGSILRNTPHSKVASTAIELGLDQIEIQQPLTEEFRITETIKDKLESAGYTVEDALNYIRNTQAKAGNSRSRKAR